MKILIVGPSWVGDMVMAQSLFITLRQRSPECEIHVLAPGWCIDLLAHMPEISATITMTVGHGELALSRRRAIAREIKKQQFNQAIILPNSFKSALIPWFAGIPIRTGWRGEARSLLINDCRKLDKNAYPLMVQRFIALAYPDRSSLTNSLPKPALQVNASSVETIKEKLGLDTTLPVLVICPGAEFGETKKWPASAYAEVASHWLRHGKGQVWVMGSANEQTDAEQIRASLAPETLNRCLDLSGKTSLSEAIDLISCAQKVISNDSGLMHIAAALQRPLVVIYGSTSPDFTPPLTDKVSIVSLELDCSPCFKRQCPLGHTNCLRQLKADVVIQSLQQLDAS